jgi:hypothetical protein
MKYVRWIFVWELITNVLWTCGRVEWQQEFYEIGVQHQTFKISIRSGVIGCMVAEIFENEN